MLRTRSIFKQLCRFKHGKDHWSVKRKKIETKDRAMEHFDEFYGELYGPRWESIKQALLTKHKYIAMVNNFGEEERISSMFESMGGINVRELYKSTKRFQDEEEPDESYANNAAGLNEKMSSLVEDKRKSEIGEFYHGKDFPIDLDLSASEKKESKEEELPVKDNFRDKFSIDHRKSLEQAMKEDAEIDQSRIIDPSFVEGTMYEYIPATKLKGIEDYVPESDHYRYYSNVADFPLNIEMEEDFSIPENLQLYTFEMENDTEFPICFRTNTGTSSHFLLNGSSILPPLALNIQPGDIIFDACASPGGKTLLMLQTLRPRLLVSNDSMQNRAAKVKKMLKEFVYDFETSWKNHRCVVREEDARECSDYDTYDKVLVDVPCTTDRHVVNENDNNIFKPSRIKERLRIPEVQSAILSNCIRLLKPGGDLVYSTCTLSPVQNDGVIHMALSHVFKEFGITMTIKDLSQVMRPFIHVFKFEHPSKLKYGQLVIPHHSANFGPMYLCKMTRN